jgi:hypothetical protein
VHLLNVWSSGSFSHRLQSPYFVMALKRKLSVDSDAADAPFETVEETEVEEMTDRAVHLQFETMGETASEIDSTTTAHTELPPHHKSLKCIAWSTRRKTPTPV